MCGITGAIALNEKCIDRLSAVEASVQALRQRGPDHHAVYRHGQVALGHARLSIFDTSAAGNQPFSDDSGRYTMVFNGEFYNFKHYRKQLLDAGVQLRSETDTEVLLHLYMQDGPAFLQKVNGFFALAIFDREADSVFLARDRMGIKPLLVYQSDDLVLFGSEMKALLAYDMPREIDRASLFAYLQLNYTPGPATMLRGVQKLAAGGSLLIKNIHSKPTVERSQWYQLPFHTENYAAIRANGYQAACKQLETLLQTSVERRLAADVPVGTFLSGGIDSSVITALATRQSSQVNSFSIGFADNPFFDETEYAQAVAKMYGTNHTVFSLTQNDLFAHLHNVLDYIDEPFADSSAINVYILSQETRKHVTVSLSGDGADEMFGGYNKHMADWRARNPRAAGRAIGLLAPVWSAMPKSRNSKVGNLMRQLDKFARGMRLSNRERYWQWASILTEEAANYLLAEAPNLQRGDLSPVGAAYQQRKETILKYLRKEGDLNEVLFTDMHLVLQNDMLTKVDLMSMANSLEVRTPFLDHEVVEFAFQLPPEYKIAGGMKKKILQDTFKSALPPILYNRPKKGFEVPLLDWFRTGLRSTIEQDLLAEGFVAEQGIFNPAAVQTLRKQLFSNNPGDAPATIWALLVFQHWWKKYLA